MQIRYWQLLFPCFYLNDTYIHQQITNENIFVPHIICKLDYIFALLVFIEIECIYRSNSSLRGWRVNIP